MGWTLGYLNKTCIANPIAKRHVDGIMVESHVPPPPPFPLSLLALSAQKKRPENAIPRHGGFFFFAGCDGDCSVASRLGTAARRVTKRRGEGGVGATVGSARPPTTGVQERPGAPALKKGEGREKPSVVQPSDVGTLPTYLGRCVTLLRLAMPTSTHRLPSGRPSEPTPVPPTINYY
ncbi:hypothetical protein LZ30DRAFT_125919 [Colletotrichum cereale]|nr:hypothetical protein LZ30DRAFT_125919 [Colletotrichum cereale]